MRAEEQLIGRYGLLFLVVSVTACLDQGTKALAVATLNEAEVFPVLAGLLEFRLRHNTGLAWGLGAGLWPGVQHLVWSFMGLGLAVGLIVLYVRIKADERVARVGVALIIGGGLANLVDRARLGYVVDFISVRIAGGGVAVAGTFNLADAAMVIGVGLLAAIMLYRRREPTHNDGDPA